MSEDSEKMVPVYFHIRSEKGLTPAERKAKFKVSQLIHGSVNALPKPLSMGDFLFSDFSTLRFYVPESKANLERSKELTQYVEELMKNNNYEVLDDNTLSRIAKEEREAYQAQPLPQPVSPVAPAQPKPSAPVASAIPDKKPEAASSSGSGDGMVTLYGNILISRKEPDPEDHKFYQASNLMKLKKYSSSYNMNTRKFFYIDPIKFNVSNTLISDAKGGLDMHHNPELRAHLDECLQQRLRCRDLIAQLNRCAEDDNDEHLKDQVALYKQQLTASKGGLDELKKIASKLDKDVAAVNTPAIIEIRKERLELQSQCRGLIEQLNTREVANNDVKVAHYQQRLTDSKGEPGELKKIVGELERDIAHSDTCLQQQSQCRGLIAQLSRCAAGNNDGNLKDRVAHYRALLSNNGGKPDELTIIANRLQRDIAAADSQQVQAIKRVIAEYKTGGSSNWLSIGKKDKAIAIENALKSVPIEDRDKIFSSNKQTPQLNAVREALASHRHFGKQNKVYYKDDAHQQIDEKKAAAAYKNLRARFAEVRDGGNQAGTEADLASSNGKRGPK